MPSQRRARPTCCPELDVNLPAAVEGVDAAGVQPLVCHPHAPQQQRCIPFRQAAGKELRPPLKGLVLVTELRVSVFVPVDESQQPLLLPGDRHPGGLLLVVFPQEDTAEEHVLADVADGAGVEARHFRGPAWMVKRH